VATSGTYERGQHIYNPHQANQTIDDIISLTIIGPNIYEADRLATAAFAMGKAGINFVETWPDCEGYLIDAGGLATMTSGFDTYLNKPNA
jgi:thiamine biosynthesis lipoprotein